MKWRLVPDLDLDIIKSQKCLLLGAGTFGCSVARNLVSMEDRTLDQQCTVTRPGVSNVASALAVELYMSILQHHDKGDAPSTEETVLGILPHSIRGFISHFTHILPSTVSFSQCIACSPIVEKSYSENKTEFLDNVFKSTKYLEDLTGLTELFKATDSLEMLELNDEDDDDDDGENLESMEDLGEI